MMQNIATRLDELNLVDKFLFDETMENPEAYSATVGILLDDEIEILEKTQTEKELRISPQLRQVRLDVSLLEPGCIDFNALNDTCFIMIAPFDIFGKGLYRYTFEGTCKECPELRLADGATRIFINTQGTNEQDFSQEFLDFMRYLTETTNKNAEVSGSSRIKIIHENVCRIKNSEKMGVRYMQTWEEKVLIRQDGKAEGKIEGKMEGKIEGRIEDILELLGEHGEIPKDIKERIEQEKEEKVLKDWLKKAAAADSIEEFMGKM